MTIKSEMGPGSAYQPPTLEPGGSKTIRNDQPIPDVDGDILHSVENSIAEKIDPEHKRHQIEE